MNDVTDEPQQRESNDPTFWSRQLEILYSVLLSASLGVALGTGLPDATWTEFQGARTVWAVTILGVTAVSIDAWYNLNQIIRSAKFGRSQGVQTGILALSFLVFRLSAAGWCRRPPERVVIASASEPICCARLGFYL